jgi:hypothetical protein
MNVAAWRPTQPTCQTTLNLEQLAQWLNTPDGSALAHGLALLFTSVAGLFSVWARNQAKKNETLLNGHLKDHVAGRTGRWHSHPRRRKKPHSESGEIPD